MRLYATRANGFESTRQMCLSRTGPFLQPNHSSFLKRSLNEENGSIKSYYNWTLTNTSTIGDTGRACAAIEFKGPGRSAVATFRNKNAASIWSMDYKSIKERLGAAGLAGLAAYGLFNTLYYFLAFVLVWSRLGSNAVSGQGIIGACLTVTKTLAVVWAGSQVTKVPRLLAALSTAPVMDKLLGLLQKLFKLKSKQQVGEILFLCRVMLFSLHILLLHP